MEKFTGFQYLAIDVANQFGLDKEQFADRLAWVIAHEALPTELESLVEQAENPFQYLAAVMAYRDAQNGIPTGHLVGMDACASGIQIMAALTGCPITAASCGLIGQKRADIYGDTTKVMGQILGEEFTVDRKLVKKAEMTHFYGSKAKPKELFGEGTPEFNAFYKAIQQVAPGACELMDVLLASWQPFELSHDWIMPDGFNVHVKVMTPVETKIEVDELDHAVFNYRHEINLGTETGLSIAANVVHSIDGMVVREMARRCNWDQVQLGYAAGLIGSYLDSVDPETDRKYIPLAEELAMKSGFVSLVGIEHVNPASIYDFGHEYLTKLLDLIYRTISRKSFPLITIHDEFKAHPNNMNEVRQTYIDIMAEIAESSILEFVLSQVQKKPVPVEKYSQDLGELIRKSEYALS